EMITIYAAKPLRHVQLFAMWMADAIEPGLFIEANRLDDKRGIPFPVPDGSSQPKRVGVGGQRPAICINAAQRVIVFVDHQRELRRLHEFKWIRMKIDARH